jgi:hypothetical protein
MFYIIFIFKNETAKIRKFFHSARKKTSDWEKPSSRNATTATDYRLSSKSRAPLGKYGFIALQRIEIRLRKSRGIHVYSP